MTNHSGELETSEDGLMVQGGGRYTNPTRMSRRKQRMVDDHVTWILDFIILSLHGAERSLLRRQFSGS
jgi:hypothetical protein